MFFDLAAFTLVILYKVIVWVLSGFEGLVFICKTDFGWIFFQLWGSMIKPNFCSMLLQSMPSGKESGCLSAIPHGFSEGSLLSLEDTGAWEDGFQSLSQPCHVPLLLHGGQGWGKGVRSRSSSFRLPGVKLWLLPCCGPSDLALVSSFCSWADNNLQGGDGN